MRWRMDELVVLVGMMGSGKSRIGRQLAAILKVPCLDNDELVERATGRSARELTAEAGEEALRTAESDALARALATPPPAVVCAAAGTVLREPDRATLAGLPCVVWLRASPAALARRLTSAASGHRPWQEGGPDAARRWLERENASREALFAEVANHTIEVERVDGADRSDGEIVADILARLHVRPGETASWS